MVVVVGEIKVGEIVVVVGEIKVGEIVVVVGEIKVGEIVVVVGEIWSVGAVSSTRGESIGFSSGAVNTLLGATVVAGVVTRAAGLPPSALPPSSSRRDCGASTGIGVGLPKMPAGGTTSTGARLLGSATKAVCSRLTRMATPARF